MLLCTSPREALLTGPPLLLGTCLPSLLSPIIPLNALTLTSLLLAKVRLSLNLTLSPLMIWCFGQTALFLFLLAKADLAYLLTALSEALMPLFPSQQAQYAQVSLLKPAPFFTFFAGLGSTIKSATALLLLSDPRSAFSSIFPLPETLWKIWKKLSSLSSCSIKLQ